MRENHGKDTNVFTLVSLLQKDENRWEGPQTETKSVQRETIQRIVKQEKAQGSRMGGCQSAEGNLLKTNAGNI